MVRDAEEHAVEDQKFRELAEMRNLADGQIHAATTMIKDKAMNLAEKASAELEGSIALLVDAAKGDSADAIETALENLKTLVADVRNQSVKDTDRKASTSSRKSDKGDNVVDADFEDVTEDESESAT